MPTSLTDQIEQYLQPGQQISQSPSSPTDSVKSQAGSQLLNLLSNRSKNLPEQPIPCPDFLYTTKPCVPWAPHLPHRNPSPNKPHQQQQPSSSLSDTDTIAFLQAIDTVTVNIKNTPHNVSGIVSPIKTLLKAGDASLLRQAGLHTLSEDTLVAAIDVFFTFIDPSSPTTTTPTSTTKHPNDTIIVPMLSVEQCCMLTREMVLPHLVALDDGTVGGTNIIGGGTSINKTRHPSKGLAVALQHMSRSCPIALMDACFIPLLQSTGLSRYQTELIRETVKHWGGNTSSSTGAGETTTTTNNNNNGTMIIPQHHHFQLISTLCTTTNQYWNEHSVDIMTDLIHTRYYSKYITDQVLEVVLGGISTQAIGEEMQKSVKFAKLMLSVVKGWPQQLRGMSPVKIQQLRVAAQGNGTFMSKSIVTALDKLLL